MLKKIAVAFSLSLLITVHASSQSASENALSAVRRSDAATRDADGSLSKLTVAEHMRRANIYAANRAFAEARAHWNEVIQNYPQDGRVPEALFGIGRSHFLAKSYQDGYVILNEVVQKYPGTKEEREALNYSAASLLRMGKFSESAARYEEYINRFPNGERIDTAHLNMIDTLREADRPSRRTRLGYAHQTTFRRQCD